MAMTMTSDELSRLRPYASIVAQACKVLDFDPFDFAAIGYRETAWGYAEPYSPKGHPFGFGDKGHGFGLFQLDDRYQQARIRRVQILAQKGEQVKAVELMITEALLVLVGNRNQLLHLGAWDTNALRRAILSSYNAGVSGVFASIQKHGFVDGVDRRTTGGDYSAWVVEKSWALRQVAPSMFGEGAHS